MTEHDLGVFLLPPSCHFDNLLKLWGEITGKVGAAIFNATPPIRKLEVGIVEINVPVTFEYCLAGLVNTSPAR